MERRTFLLGLTPAAASFAASPDPNTLTAEEKSQGWKLLFDGRSLEHWEDPAKEKPAGDCWLIADGCIKSKPKALMREDLLTKAAYENFEFKFEWRISPGGNSGVKYLLQDRIAIVEGQTDMTIPFEARVEQEFRTRKSSRSRVPPGKQLEEYTCGFEYQVIDDTAHPDAKKSPDRRSGAVYSLVEPVNARPRPVGEFNESRLVVRGLRVEHWLNGTRVVQADLGDPAIAKRLSERWVPGSKMYELLTKVPKRKAPFALQHHIDEVWFRGLKVLTGRRPAA